MDRNNELHKLLLACHRADCRTRETSFLTLFDSRGVHWMTTGTWDKPTNTFRFEGHSGETSVKIKSVFQDNDQTEAWTITLLSPNGDVFELRGTNKKLVK